MKRTKFKLDYKGVGELMRSKEMADLMTEYAEAVRGRCGDGYAVSSYPNGRTRANASVYAETEKAIRDNYDNNTLLKAVR